MPSPLIIPQNLTWVLLIFPVLFSPFSFASRTTEISLICGTDKYAISAFLIQTGETLMNKLQNQIVEQKWGYASFTSRTLNAYALGQCHSDLSDQDCQLCFKQGSVKFTYCVPSSSGRIYLDGCFVRFDNYSFFHEYIDPWYDSVKCSEPTGVLTDDFKDVQFKNKVAEVIENVTATAVANESFAVVDSKGGILPVYALAQCWGTLDKEECRKCLGMAGSKLKECAPGDDGSALFTGCYIRYSTSEFFKQRVEKIVHRGSLNAHVVAFALSAVALGVLISVGAFIGYLRLLKRKKDQNNLGHSPASSNLNFKYEVLERATDFFHESRKLGKGGAGTVFKGNLPDGRVVAVKRLVYNTSQWVDQFFNEVNLISGIKHKNLVMLLGCSIEGPQSLIVYEYVTNRSLDQILFVNNTIHILSWRQRFNIILGTAEGLAYLHGGSTPIIHRDIKSSNILLDNKLTPKIADFGLALCVATESSHNSTGIAGTLGYMAPEYLVRGQLTEKADVYSFGVLVLEIACGKKNSIYTLGLGSILNAVWKHYKANTITKAIDPRLKGRFSEEEATDVLQIGLLCTQPSAALRPSMAEVVQMLTNRESKIPSPKQPPFLNASVLTTDDCTENSITRASLTNSCPINEETLAEVPLTSGTSSYTTASLYHSSMSASLHHSSKSACVNHSLKSVSVNHSSKSASLNHSSISASLYHSSKSEPSWQR